MTVPENHEAPSSESSGPHLEGWPSTSTEDDPSGRDEVVRHWVAAIARGDSKTLMLLYAHNQSNAEFPVADRKDYFKELGCQLGSQGRNALHVAAMQGCFPLAKLLLDIFLEQDTDCSGPEYFSLLYHIYLPDAESGLSALDMAQGVIGDHSIAQLIIYVTGKVTEFSEDVNLFQAYNGTPFYIDMVQYVKEGNDHNETADRGLLSHLRENPRRVHETLHSIPILLKEGNVHNETADRRLLSHLRENPRRVHETLHGIPILHLAICRNDFYVVNELLEFFGPQKELLWDGDHCFPPNLPLEAVLNPSFWDASSLPDDVFGSMTKRVKHFLKKCGGSALQLATSLGHDKIREKLSTWCPLEKEYSSESASVHRFNATAKEMKLADRLGQVYWNTEWDKGLDEDVDFNFVDKRVCPPSLFRVHHACKDPRKFHEFFHDIGRKFNVKYNPELADEKEATIDNLFLIHDPQGRTPWHILLDYYIHQKFSTGSFYSFENFRKGFPFEKCNFGVSRALLYGVTDKRGRTLYDCGFSKSYLRCDNLVHLGPYHQSMDFMHCLYESFSLEQLQMAIVTKHTQDALMILSKMSLKEINMPNEIMHPLLLAASLGNQIVLRSLLQQCDPMIVDDEERSSLHHAADASLAEELTKITQCFSTVEDMCKVRKKWIQERDEEVLDEPLQGNSTLDGKGKAMENEKQLHVDLIAKRNVERKACILMLLQAGVDLSQSDKSEKVPDVGPTSDGAHQSWWYDMVVTDLTDKKNSFNQAGNALSVVGALVAATSYIGPLQPPSGYNGEGFVETTQTLVELFMVSNTLAFYLAMASAMFAVVPSLPMPQESVMCELRRARHIVSFSLCLIIFAAICMMVSFAAASLAVMQYEHSFRRTDLLFWPSIIGWLLCFIAIINFIIRVMRLIFYSNPEVRRVYKLSPTKLCKDVYARISVWVEERRAHLAT